MIIKLYKNDNLINEEEFSTKLYYEQTLIDLGLKYNLLNLPLDYFKNNLEGLKIRRNYKLNQADKDNIISKLNKDELKLINILNKNLILDTYKSIDNYLNLINNYQYGNLNDIYSYILECKNNIDKIIINI